MSKVLKKELKNVKVQTIAQYENQVAKSIDASYDAYLKRKDKKEFTQKISELKFKINIENETAKVDLIASDIEFLNKFITAKAEKDGKLTNNEFKKMLGKVFYTAYKFKLTTIEKHKEFNQLAFTDTFSPYTIFKYMNLLTYFNNKSIIKNNITKQYESKNILK